MTNSPKTNVGNFDKQGPTHIGNLPKTKIIPSWIKTGVSWTQKFIVGPKM